MSELRALAQAAREVRARGEPFLSATVVRVRGSGYRRPGAQMLVDRERWLAGSISGGCLERDVLAKGFWRTRRHAAQLVSYDADDVLDDRVGSGCQGVISVLIERHEPEPGPCDMFQLIERCLREEERAVSLRVFHSTHPEVPVGACMFASRGELLSSDRSGWLQRSFADELVQVGDRPHTALRQDGQGAVEALVQLILPPPHLFVFGAGHDALPLVQLSKQLGWTVSVWDALPRSETRQRFLIADAYLTDGLAAVLQRMAASACPLAVVMSHNLAQDGAALRALLASNVQYLGVLGPRRRTEQLLADARNEGAVHDDETLARLHAPVGLQLGADTPAEVALSIVAEAQAAIAKVRVASLRSQTGAIHASASDALREGARG